MSEMQNKTVIDDMERDAKYQIITLEDENEHSSKAKKILRDLNEEISHLYAEFKIWMDENTDYENMNPRIAKLKADTELLFHKTKMKIKELKEDEDLQEKIQIGKEFIVENTVKAVDFVNDGVQEVLRQENVKKVVDNVSDAYYQFKNDERVKHQVKKFKKGTIRVAESALDGLKKVLDDDTTDEDKQ